MQRSSPPRSPSTISFSRRDVEGRLLGRSPLIGDLKEIYLGRGRIPEHAASESDRLLARPSEFAAMPVAVSGLACWRDWQRPEITAHDGFVGRTIRVCRRYSSSAMSATSLKLLLRDPIRFVWRYALGWKQPEEADEPLTLDALAFGNLVHGVLRDAVDALEAAGGFGNGQPERKSRKRSSTPRRRLPREWESEQPVPPAVIWRNTLERAEADVVGGAALSARCARRDRRAGPRFRSERGVTAKRKNLPWDVDQAVEIPGTGISIQGHIDRLDLSGDMKRARVIDYKTGQLNKKMADVVINGGSELQRCLYAFAVKTLLGQQGRGRSRAALSAGAKGEQALFPLADVDAVLEQLATAIGLARKNMIAMASALPGIDADDRYNDFAFALPASPSYLPRKLPLARERLGEAAKIWEEP